MTPSGCPAANAALDRTGFMLEALGLVDLAEGDDESAARRFAAALKVPARAHSDLNTRLGLGYALANLGRKDEAKKAAHAYLELAPADAEMKKEFAE